MELKLGTSGTVTIPETLQKELDWQPGTSLSATVVGDQLVIKRQSDLPKWKRYRGIFSGTPDLLNELAREHAKELAKDDERIANL
ncbi:hypothetical protein F183_A43020 [Bryobacterales bacterium F-183]|nr:hypothetical protein F183_A43020 [Bryobacterales bacterium F-183]